MPALHARLNRAGTASTARRCPGRRTSGIFSAMRRHPQAMHAGRIARQDDAEGAAPADRSSPPGRPPRRTRDRGRPRSSPRDSPRRIAVRRSASPARRAACCAGPSRTASRSWPRAARRSRRVAGVVAERQRVVQEDRRRRRRRVRSSSRHRADARARARISSCASRSRRIRPTLAWLISTNGRPVAWCGARATSRLLYGRPRRSSGMWSMPPVYRIGRSDNLVADEPVSRQQTSTRTSARSSTGTSVPRPARPSGSSSRSGSTGIPRKDVTDLRTTSTASASSRTSGCAAGRSGGGCRRRYADQPDLHVRDRRIDRRAQVAHQRRRLPDRLRDVQRHAARRVFPEGQRLADGRAVGPAPAAAGGRAPGAASRRHLASASTSTRAGSSSC